MRDAISSGSIRRRLGLKVTRSGPERDHMLMTEVPMLFADCALLWTAEDLYTPEECARFIVRIEAAKPGLATNNPLYRDQDRVIEDDPDTAADLMRRLRPHLPPKIGGLNLYGLNERLRMYRYRPGQKFSLHTDHWYQPTPHRITLLTVLVYFNGDFQGGETQFHQELRATIRPRPGRVAVFQHKVNHEGRPVTSGVKYALRTDVFYDAPTKIHLTRQYPARLRPR